MALIPTLSDAEGDVADADEYYIFELVNVDGEEQLSRLRMRPCSISWPIIFRISYAQAMEDEEE